MIIVHGTQVFRDRVPGTAAQNGETSTTAMGSWYATVLRWRRPAALLVNETTLLPLLLPLAPARTLLHRFPAVLAELLAMLDVPPPLINAERAQMATCRLAPTANRSVVGVMTEFAFLAGVARTDQDDLLQLSMRLAATPCGPLYQRHISPDQELAALVADLAPHTPTPTPG